ncbi:MAG: hypothetical protein AMJ79_00455 [Phycisphaerae bacterium SM23_30]|nr:MAG: hypothetical protein AMJ79_00455 [Phycisphaerae bacterium SM23_30]
MLRETDVYFKTRIPAVVVLLITLTWSVAAANPEDKSPPRYAVRAGKIVTCAGDPIDNGTILVSGGKIEAIGPRDQIEIPEGYKVLDHREMFAMPGLVEAHSHVGAQGGFNDSVYPTVSGLEIAHQIQPYNDALKEAIQGGVTTILYIPGSGNNLAGIGVVMKTRPGTAEEVIIKNPGCLKIAQAGNPERRSSGELGSGRAGMNWVLREKLRKGQRYYQKWLDYEQGRTDVKPEVDLQLEIFRPVFKGEIPVVIHTQMFQVVMETLRMFHDEFGLKGAIHHGTFDAYRVADEVAKRDFPCCIGPRVTVMDRENGQIVGVVAGYYARGARNLFVNVDATGSTQEDLHFQAALGVRYGWPEEDGLYGLTIRPARYLMVDDRVGSLEVGKDADIVIKNGPVMDLRSAVVKVLIDGEVVYDAAQDRRIY